MIILALCNMLHVAYIMIEGLTMLDMASLKDIRGELKITQEQLASRAGVPLRTFARAEAGGKVKYSTAKAILDAVNAVRSEQGKPELTSVEDVGLSLE